MKVKSSQFPIELFGLILILSSCYYHHYTEVVPDQNIAVQDSIVCFSTQVLPILKKNCASELSCHLVELGSYKNIIGDNYVHLGLNASYSKLYYQIALCDPEDRMPPADRDPLTENDKETIKRWIDQGATNDLNCK